MNTWFGKRIIELLNLVGNYWASVNKKDAVEMVKVQVFLGCNDEVLSSRSELSYRGVQRAPRHPEMSKCFQ